MVARVRGVISYRVSALERVLQAVEMLTVGRFEAYRQTALGADIRIRSQETQPIDLLFAIYGVKEAVVAVVLGPSLVLGTAPYL